MTDTNQLLREYVKTGSEPAFREIVARYVDLVYSVAIRKLGGHEHLARDVVQTVFTDLARKASRLRAESCLGGWLHRHTCFISSTLRRAEQRRLAREQIAVEMNQNEPSEATWQRLAPMLDEAVDQLGAADRQAIILRFYERRDLRSVGAALGTSEDAAQKRLSRALEKLRAVMARKGASLSVAMLASVLTTRAVLAAPVGMAAEAAESALAAAATGGIVATLITLMTSLKMSLALGTAALAIVAGAVIYHSSQKHTSDANPALRVQQGASTSSDTAPDATTVADNNPNVPAEPTLPPAADTLRLTIVAADSGKPVPGVVISYRGFEKEKFKGKQFVANRGGICDVAVPRATITQLQLTSIAEGFADTRLEWQTDRGEIIPQAYTLRLVRPAPISGRVLDPDGQPLAGAKMGWNHQEDPAHETRPESHRFSWIEVETDSDGRWQINRIAPEMLKLLYGSPRHPDYTSPSLLMVTEKPAVEQELRHGTHVFRMGRALSISGTVADPDGKPVAEAGVRVGGVGDAARRETKSLPDGSFVVGGCKPGRNVITAESAGFAPSSIEVDLSATTGPVRLVLQRGKTLKLRLVDKAGQPIDRGNVWYDTMRQMRTQTGKASPPAVQVEFSPVTDADGRAVWQGAPEGELYFSFAKNGYMRQDDVLLPADGQEHVVTLSPALIVSGTVKDADTGDPIPKFRIACGWPSPGPNGDIQPRFSDIDRFWLTFANGQFKHAFEEPLVGGMPSNPGYMLRFEAEGYAMSLSRVIKEEEGEVTLEVKLSKAADLPVSVLLPDGQPAVGIEVGLQTPGRQLHLVPGGFSRRNSGGGGVLQTDAHGVFKLPPDDTVQLVVAAGSAGYSQSTPAALRADPTLRLQAWGRIEGSFASGNKAADRTLNLDPVDHGPAAVQFEFRSFQVRTDEQGHFIFPQVPPGRWNLVRLIESEEGENTAWIHTPLQIIEVQAGQTTQLTFGANARPVTARVRLPSGLQRQRESKLFAFVHTPFAKPPAEVQKDPAALQTWAQSSEVRAQIDKARSYQMNEAGDGTWTAEEVPPGDYLLSVNLLGKPESDGSMKPAATAEVHVTIPAGNTAEPFDAGEVVLQQAP